jgi:hypothetical protein
MIWVNSGSVFILAIQQRGFNDSTAFTRSATTATGSPLDSLQNGGTELFRVRRGDQYISSKGVDWATRPYLRMMRLLRSRHYGQFRIFLLDFVFSY